MSRVIGVGLILFFFSGWEHLFPKFRIDSTWQIWSVRVAGNLGLGFLYRILFAPLFIAPAIVYFLSAHTCYSRPGWLAGGSAVLIDLVLLDLLNYWTHVAAHQSRLLWRFHAVHHLDISLDVTTAFRQHFGEKFLLLGLRIPVLVMLAMPYSTVLLSESISLGFAMFHHSNIALPVWLQKWLGKIFVLPAFHDIHHGRERGHTDSNYGFVLSVWDRLFGTVSIEDRTLAQHFANGLDGHGHLSLSQLIALPFTRVPVSQWPSSSPTSSMSFAKRRHA